MKLKLLSDASDIFSDMTQGMDDMLQSLSWKMKLMMYWNSLSQIHKIIGLVVFALIAFFIICKVFKCVKKCSCH
jgi:hypothetical protein